MACGKSQKIRLKLSVAKKQLQINREIPNQKLRLEKNEQ